MLTFLLVLVVLSLAVGGVTWLLVCRRRTLFAEREAPSLLLIQQQLDGLRGQFGQALDNNIRAMQQQVGQLLKHVTDRLKENSEALQKTQESLGERLDNAARVVGNVQKTLGGLEEANRKLYDVAKDIATLQEILRAPKLRGGFGEFFLEELLAQILPPKHYMTQYSFASGEKVDAVIKLGNSLVPVDSKFPLENFKRFIEAAGDDQKARAKRLFTADVRRHIDAISEKYILPDEGTYDFALMYIPAENVYYETIIKDDSSGDKNLIQYALGKRVIAVSPSSLYAYLQAIVLGLRGMKIEDRAKEVLQYLSGLQNDFSKFKDEYLLVGKHLSHAQASFQSAEKRLEQFGQKLLSADADPTELQRNQIAQG